MKKTFIFAESFDEMMSRIEAFIESHKELAKFKGCEDFSFVSKQHIWVHANIGFTTYRFAVETTLNRIRVSYLTWVDRKGWTILKEWSIEEL